MQLVGWVEFFTRPNIVQRAPKRWVSPELDPTYGWAVAARY